MPESTLEECPETNLRDLWEEAHVAVRESFSSYKFNLGLDKTFTFVRGINRYVEERAPWKLAKSEVAEDRSKLDTSLAVMVEAFRLAVALLAPVMPGVNARVNTLLGTPETTLWEADLEWDHRLFGNALGEKTILFPRN